MAANETWGHGVQKSYGEHGSWPNVVGAKLAPRINAIGGWRTLNNGISGVRSCEPMIWRLTSSRVGQEPCFVSTMLFDQGACFVSMFCFGQRPS